MKPDIKREVWRKVVQVIVGTGLIIGILRLTIIAGSSAVLWVLLGLLCGALVLDQLMAVTRWRIPLYDHLRRPKERGTLHGPTWLLLGVLLSAVYYPLPVALAAAGNVFFGDAAAAVVGMLIRSPRLVGKKTLAGSTAMFFVSWASATVFTQNWHVAGLMAGVATIVELISTNVDDNLLVPIVSGFIGYVMLG